MNTYDLKDFGSRKTIGLQQESLNRIRFTCLWEIPFNLDNKCIYKCEIKIAIKNMSLYFRILLPLLLIFCNVTLNNILVISWRSVLLVEETRVPGENHRPVASRHLQTFSHIVASSTPHHEPDPNSKL